MIQHLEHLIATKQYPQALQYVDQIWHREVSLWDMLSINAALAEARLGVGEAFGAQVAGELALSLAQELEAWDPFAKICVVLGVAYDRLGQFDKAIAIWYEYLAALPRYSEKARSLEATVWFNLGMRHARNREYDEALQALVRATQAAERIGDRRKAHGIRQGLIGLYLKTGLIDLIPRLMAQCGHYLRHQWEAPDRDESLLYHRLLRIEFAIRTKRFDRALRLAQKALSHITEQHIQQFHLYILIAEIYKQTGREVLAAQYLGRARFHAIRLARHDLEGEAAERLHQLAITKAKGGHGLQHHPGFPDPHMRP